MPFVPTGKKGEKKRLAAIKEEARDRVIDRAVGLAQFVTRRSNLCLQTSVLVERLLGELGLPGAAFSTKLGSLKVYAEETDGGCIFFDPRDDSLAPAAFHVWLEDTNGHVLDPTINLTLLNEGYDVDATTYFIAPRRTTYVKRMKFEYEVLPDLEILELEASEPGLRALMDLALLGKPLTEHHVIPLDIGWRGKGPLPR